MVSTFIDPRIVFDHVPKTAGCALIGVLSDLLGDRARRIANGPHRVALQNNHGIAMIAGHLWYAPGERLQPNWYYATVLREPLDRFLSHYYFAANDFNAADDYPAAMTRRWSIEDYVSQEDPLLVGFYSNVQARHFAPLALGPGQDPASLSDQELLEAAKTGLRSFALVGVYPHLHEFTARACRDHGLSAPPVIPKVNVTSRRLNVEELSPRARRRLEEANQVDRELYWWAAEEFVRAAPRARAVAEPAAVPATAADFGSREIEVVGVECTEEAATAVRVEIECEVHEGVGPFTVGIAVIDSTGRTAYGTNTHKLGIPVVAETLGRRRFVFLLNGHFGPGAHSVTVALHRGAAHLDGCFHWQDEAGTFTIELPEAHSAGCDPIKGAFYEQPVWPSGQWKPAQALAG